MSFKTNDIIFLIGAGCSYNASIPTANKMVEDIEKTLLPTDKKWKEFRELYCYIKSAILYGDGIFGNFNNAFNIEKFVNVLSELEKKERNVVYPFIANWNNRLIDLAGKDFENLKTFKELITEQLIGWITPYGYQQKAQYYKGFYNFQRAVELPLRIFSLNYDLCFEETKPHDFNLELGFDESMVWNYLRFEDNPQEDVGIYLYKLHGSATWLREEKTNILKMAEHPPKNPDLIFGTYAKLQSIDPYLFYVYELRKYSLESKLIVVIGYSYGDSYVNNLLKQALEHDKSRKLISVATDEADNRKDAISRKLLLDDSSQIEFIPSNAKDFLETTLTLGTLSKYVPSSLTDIF